jgi:hypothetical protein
MAGYEVITEARIPHTAEAEGLMPALRRVNPLPYTGATVQKNTISSGSITHYRVPAREVVRRHSSVWP